LAGCKWYEPPHSSEEDKELQTEDNPNSAAAGQMARDFVGLSNDEGDHYDDEGNFMTLASLNDGGETFAKIADIIESEPVGLFINPEA
jgi:hypothetical protein